MRKKFSRTFLASVLYNMVCARICNNVIIQFQHVPARFKNSTVGPCWSLQVFYTYLCTRPTDLKLNIVRYF